MLGGGKPGPGEADGEEQGEKRRGVGLESEVGTRDSEGAGVSMSLTQDIMGH